MDIPALILINCFLVLFIVMLFVCWKLSVCSVLCWAEAKGPRRGEGSLSPAPFKLFFSAFKENLGENLSNLPRLGKQTNIYLEFLMPLKRVKGGERQNLHFGPGSVCGKGHVWMGRSEKIPQPGVVFPGQLWKVSQANLFIPGHCISIAMCTGGDVRYTSTKWLRRRKLSGSHKLKRVMVDFMGSSTLNIPCSFSIAVELTLRQQLTGLYFILRSLYFKKPICCFLPLPLQFLSWKQMIMELGLPCHCLKCPLRSLLCFVFLSSFFSFTFRSTWSRR